MFYIIKIWYYIQNLVNFVYNAFEKLFNIFNERKLNIIKKNNIVSFSAKLCFSETTGRILKTNHYKEDLIMMCYLTQLAKVVFQICLSCKQNQSLCAIFWKNR